MYVGPFRFRAYAETVQALVAEPAKAWAFLDQVDKTSSDALDKTTFDLPPNALKDMNYAEVLFVANCVAAYLSIHAIDHPSPAKMAETPANEPMHEEIIEPNVG